MGFFKWLKKDVSKAPKRVNWLSKQPWVHALIKAAAYKYGVRI